MLHLLFQMVHDSGSETLHLLAARDGTEHDLCEALLVERAKADASNDPPSVGQRFSFQDA